jgi:integrase
MSNLPALAPPTDLPESYERMLAQLLVKGANPNTLRGYETDLRYLRAWKRLSFDADLAFPESESVALRFILDHSTDLAALDPQDPPRRVAEALIGAGLRRSLAAPTPGSLGRRIANWRTFHAWKEVPSPFELPSVKRALKAARRASGRAPAKKSARAVTSKDLDALLAATGPGLAGMRDRALLETGWSSGGRRRSELAALRVEDLDLTRFDKEGVVGIALRRTKTHQEGPPPRLALRGRPARTLVAWLDAAGIGEGPVFRRVSAERVDPSTGLTRPGRVLEKGLSGEGIRQIVKRLVAAARPVLGEDYDASPHGLRSGFLTEAARRGVPVQAAMRMSLHRSAAQAMAYYDDAEIEDNPGVALRE